VPEPLAHYEGCFGCGHANLFGLQLEARRTAEGAVEARFFVKQDHQGPPGIAHGGVVTTALDEAMALAVWDGSGLTVTARLEVELLAPAPVGTFVEVRARLERDEGRRRHLLAEATGEDGEPIARARGLFVRR
jgi:acyl-coenzyme A thioesterase PaaI-like protein